MPELNPYYVPPPFAGRPGDPLHKKILFWALRRLIWIREPLADMSDGYNGPDAEFRLMVVMAGLLCLVCTNVLIMSLIFGQGPVVTALATLAIYLLYEVPYELLYVRHWR